MQIECRKEKMLSAGVQQVSTAEESVNRLTWRREKVGFRDRKFEKLMKMKKITSSMKNRKISYERKRSIIKKGDIFGRNLKIKINSRREEKFGLTSKWGFQNFRMPSTPHNTSQYLISNFAKCRKENVFNLISKYTNYLQPQIHTMMIDDVITVEDICVSGGSMREIIASRGGIIEEIEEEIQMDPLSENLDEKTNFTNCTNFTHKEEDPEDSINEEESTVEDNSYFPPSVNNITYPENNEAHIYLDQVTKQHREIQNLIQKLKHKNKDSNFQSGG